MKKQILAAVAILALSAGAAYAAPAGNAAAGAGLLGSVHDMPHMGMQGGETQGRICAFCHTPHHADTTQLLAPLWSRNMTLVAASYAAYNSNTFDDSNMPNPKIGPTALCLSCHDGNIAIDTHYGNAGTVGNKVVDSGAYGTPGLAKNGLTDTHPVGFKYDAIADAGSPALNNVDGPLVATAQYPYIRFFGDDGFGVGTLLYKNNTNNIKVKDRLFFDGTNYYMTCATCHDVHNRKNIVGGDPVNYLTLSPQNGSALCLTCHIK